MNWLNKLDEIATQLLPEEDRNYQNGRNNVVMIDPLLDGDYEVHQEDDDDDDEDASSLGSQSDEEHSAEEVENLMEGAQIDRSTNPIAPASSILFQQSTGDVTGEHRPLQDSSREAQPLSDLTEGHLAAHLNPHTYAETEEAIAAGRDDTPENYATSFSINDEISLDREVSSQHPNDKQTPNTEDKSQTEPLRNASQTPAFDFHSVQNESVEFLSPNQTPADEVANARTHSSSVSKHLGTTPGQGENPMFNTPVTVSLPDSQDTPVYETPLSGETVRTLLYKGPQAEETVAQTEVEPSLIAQTRQHQSRQAVVEGRPDHAPSPGEKTHPPSDINLVDLDMTDFEMATPLQEWNGSKGFRSSMNRLGVVHVRVIEAQRLPCPLGSTVKLAVSLSPWKGKVWSDPSVSFGGDDGKGVCVKWDPLDEGSGCSMVHAWNNEDTPVPTMNLELVFKPIKLLTFTMCSLDLCCKPLMIHPGIWKRQWCQATLSSTLREHEGYTEDHSPLLLVEAAFFTPADEGHETEFQTMDESTIGNTSNDALDEGSTALQSYQLRTKSRPHLLKLQSFWRPANCSVCNRSIIGWKRAFRCEACIIDCCQDCQLQIDLQIPCGSIMAKSAVEKSIQNKLSLDNVLTAVAPVDENFALRHSGEPKPCRQRSIVSTFEQGKDGREVFEQQQCIGKLRIRVHRACVFGKAFPVESAPSTLFEQESKTGLKVGDYYVRVRCKGSAASQRTRTIQNTGNPRFDSPEMTLEIPHYGVEYRVDVVDAYSNKSVGTIAFTVQTLLQLQRDREVQEEGIAAFLPTIRKEKTARPVTLKEVIRTGFSEGFESDHFAQVKTRLSARKTAKVGAITGWMLLDVCVEENFEALFGPHPTSCPPTPPKTFDMELLQGHIGRLTIMVSDLKQAMNVYVYVVSWKNLPLTLSSFVLFLWACFRFNAEYAGSLPVFMLLVSMSFLAFRRLGGQLKDRFIDREKESRIEHELKASVHKSLHRPVGNILISIERGRHLRSRDLGLPGSVGCHVFWDPLRYREHEMEANSTVPKDQILKAHHDIGHTPYLYTANPDWTQIKESEDLSHLRQLLPTQGAIFNEKPTNAEENPSVSLLFPFLQPVERSKKTISGALVDEFILAPWTNCAGAIVIQVKFVDVINMLPGFEDILGEVVLPLHKLIEKQEYQGWFQVAEAGAKHVLRCDDSAESETPRIFLRLKWQPPASSDKYSDADRETSIVVAEQMMRAADRNSRNRFDIIGSSIGAFNTVRGLGGTVQGIQNSLGSVVDALETVRNILNFTDPHFSSLAFCGLFAVWTFLALIPTRTIVFVAGVVQYSVTFLARYMPGQSKGGTSMEKIPSDKIDTKQPNVKSPILTWLTNALSGIPTDEDLRKAYFWESVRIGDIESSKVATEKRAERLEQLWSAKWYSIVKIRIPSGTKKSRSRRDWHWEDRFAIVHGRRLLVWVSARDFDEGEPPVERVALSGHAGLAGLSPLESRDLMSSEIPFVVNIFGRGSKGQLKLMLLTPDEFAKDGLEEAVMSASLKDD